MTSIGRAAQDMAAAAAAFRRDTEATRAAWDDDARRMFDARYGVDLDRGAHEAAAAIAASTTQLNQALRMLG
jgi:hypothetical protein